MRHRNGHRICAEMKLLLVKHMQRLITRDGVPKRVCFKIPPWKRKDRSRILCYYHTLTITATVTGSLGWIFLEMNHTIHDDVRTVAMHEILILFAASEASIYPFKEVLFCWLFFWYSETRSHTVMSSHRLMLCFKALPCTRGRDIEIYQCLSKALTGVGTSAAWAQVQSALSLCKSARQLTQVKHLKGSLIDHHNCALLSFCCCCWWFKFTSNFG